MPIIINKNTKHQQTVSIEEWQRIQSNPLTANLFDMCEVKKPAELIEQTDPIDKAPPIVITETLDENLGDENLSEQ